MKDAYYFIGEIREKIHRVSDIATITVSGTKQGMNGEFYSRDYYYDMETGRYTGSVIDEDFESEGDSGDLYLSDLDTCDIDDDYDDDDDEVYTD